MRPIQRKNSRRGMMVLAGARRMIQKLGPYQSLALLLVPVTLVEPLKLLALLVAGEGHWHRHRDDCRRLRRQSFIR
jgi:hypothetical protein